MGCCVSTSTPTSSAQNPPPYNSKRSTAPPPSHPLLEEESVKEVLSETPALPKKPTILRAHQQSIDPIKSKSFFPNITANPDQKLRTHVECGFSKPISVFNPEEVSEICTTFSEGVSTDNYSTEKKNDDDDVGGGGDNQQRSFRHRSLSGDSGRERVVGKSPTRLSEPSPDRVRSGTARDARGLGANSGRMKDLGESSGRRSRSPATRVDGGGAKTGLVRSGSARKTGKCRGRVKSEMGDKIRKVEDPYSSFSTSSRESTEKKWPPTSNDLLENPLVSLECFIFL